MATTMTMTTAMETTGTEEVMITIMIMTTTRTEVLMIIVMMTIIEEIKGWR